MNREKELIYRLENEHSLSEIEYGELIRNRNEETTALLKDLAVKKRRAVFSDVVYIRGLIEISSCCKNNCFYCGIRRDNINAQRYRLTRDEVLECVDEGYGLGFRTFVLQGGEDPYFTDDILCGIISSVKNKYPDCAVTLSLGERSRESYQALYDAGADRYLLRHETADKEHYKMLHPEEMSFDNRINCLENLKEIGFQVGCGFMVGSPFQTDKTLAKDLKFIETFKPDMCGIGPFIPHHDTPFWHEEAGNAELTLFLLSVIRLMLPEVLLPSTTALGTIDPMGREKGILAGANVVMPNLSPVAVRRKYELYDNKICTGEESAQCVGCLKARLEGIGCYMAIDRGDAPRLTKNAEIEINGNGR